MIKTTNCCNSYDSLDCAGDKTHYPPSMATPDENMLYLASQNLAVKTDGVEALRGYLDFLLTDFRREIGGVQVTCRRLRNYEADYLAVWHTLSNLDALPDDYQSPEYYLNAVWRECLSTNRHTHNISTIAQEE